MEEKQSGSGGAADLLTTVYEELRQLAARRMAREAPGQTLQATALVHEVWLRLGGDRQPAWQNKAHFFGAAAEAMRRILIDRARHKSAVRHGGSVEQVPLEGREISCGMEDEQLLAMHEALDRLAGVDAEKAELVKLRFFAGLTTDQAAKVLGMSEATAKRYWAYARAWLYREMNRK